MGQPARVFLFHSLAQEHVHCSCPIEPDPQTLTIVRLTDESGPAARQVQRQHYREHLWASYACPRPLGALLARWTLLLRQWRDSPAAEAAFQSSAPLQFYDTWVARDAVGALLDKLAPYARCVAS